MPLPGDTAEWMWCYFFLRLMVTPARPTSPVPKSSMVAGSGTGLYKLGLALTTQAPKYS